MTMMMDKPVDAAVATAAVSSPLWLSYLTLYGQAALVVLGVVLMVLRIIAAWPGARDALVGRSVFRAFFRRD